MTAAIAFQSPAACARTSIPPARSGASPALATPTTWPGRLIARVAPNRTHHPVTAAAPNVATGKLHGAAACPPAGCGTKRGTTSATTGGMPDALTVRNANAMQARQLVATHTRHQLLATLGTAFGIRTHPQWQDMIRDAPSERMTTDDFMVFQDAARGIAQTQAQGTPHVSSAAKGAAHTAPATPRPRQEQLPAAPAIRQSVRLLELLDPVRAVNGDCLSADANGQLRLGRHHRFAANPSRTIVEKINREAEAAGRALLTMLREDLHMHLYKGVDAGTIAFLGRQFRDGKPLRAADALRVVQYATARRALQDRGIDTATDVQNHPDQVARILAESCSDRALMVQVLIDHCGGSARCPDTAAYREQLSEAPGSLDANEITAAVERLGQLNSRLGLDLLQHVPPPPSDPNEIPLPPAYPGDRAA